MFTSLVISILVLSAYTIIQILSEKQKTESVKYLFAVILILAVSQIPPFIVDKLPPARGLFIEMLPTRHWVFLIGPIVFLYAHSCMGRKSRLQDLLHFLPFFIWWIIFLIFSGNHFQPRIIPDIYGPLCITSLLAYSSLILFTLSAYTKKLRNQYSYTDIFLEIKWLYYIAAALVFITVSVYVSVSVFFRFYPPQVSLVRELHRDPEFLNILHSLAVLIFLFIFTLMAQKQEHKRILPAAVPDPGKEEPDQSGENSLEYNELISYMESSRIYLENTLSLQELSDKTGISRHELSRLINSKTGENFFHFINGFRARKFCEVIKNNKYPNYNLLGIAYECGFNSKATFNTAIKREFNKTPSQISREVRSAQ